MNDTTTGTAGTAAVPAVNDIPADSAMCTSDKRVFIGLTDPQTPANVGAVLRAAGCYGANAVYYSGSRYDNAVKHSKTNTQTEGKAVTLVHTDDFQSIIEPDMKIVCVDLIVGAVSLPDFVHPEKAVYIFGPESGTVLQNVIDIADAVVYVPTRGCMNLAASVNVLLYDRLAKDKDAMRLGGDELIRGSRQQGNNRKVKQSRKLETESQSGSVATHMGSDNPAGKKHRV